MKDLFWTRKTAEVNWPSPASEFFPRKFKKQLRHNLRHGAQSLLAVLDSSSEDEKDLDTTGLWIPSHHGVLSNLTPVPTNSDTVEEENQVAEQLMNDSHSSNEHVQGVKEVPVHDYVPVYQQGKIVSYREISPQHKNQQVPVINQGAEIPVKNKDGHVISYQQVPKKQTGLFPVYDKDGKLLSFCEELPKESGKAMGARHESMQNPNVFVMLSLHASTDFNVSFNKQSPELIANTCHKAESILKWWNIQLFGYHPTDLDEDHDQDSDAESGTEKDFLGRAHDQHIAILRAAREGAESGSGGDGGAAAA
ncbi:hypothetical protein K435DRAFT_800334 [Dendrothele bispora CBS 962.96]|uniref:Uncharacterized protein n=1 Tax=Dendrothele bispora (strain CBS 962.96) TaxID=1314807 RepID=A0A4S8LT01_DENBC|nr:hypothetical protein K435DRAFT_800334 [Dendrothele bispora CBS 962.96]